MKKILIIQNTIPLYRVPVYNELAKRHNLTIIYSYGEIQDDINFRAIKIELIKISRLFLHKKNIYKIAKNYDVVIAMWALDWISIMSLILLPRKFKVILWGIGVSASYVVRYDSIKKRDKLNAFLIRQSDAVIFYSSYPVEKYYKLGANKEKMFVANNTVAVGNQIIMNKERNTLLFIGSLYKEKKIDKLLENYLKAFMQNPNIPILYIIGGGDEYDNIKKWINQKKLHEKVFLEGPIFDEKLLSVYFNSAIASISPDQAGLSVLKSMGYGVPFITMSNAITGGERFNIINNFNGILLESFEELKTIILDIAVNPQKYLEMGKNAQQFYTNFRTVQHMVNGFDQAIEFVCNDKRNN
jgi:glycosyltransferase involved in cell wall biosynthesis